MRPRISEEKKRKSVTVTLTPENEAVAAVHKRGRSEGVNEAMEGYRNMKAFIEKLGGEDAIVEAVKYAKLARSHGVEVGKEVEGVEI